MSRITRKADQPPGGPPPWLNVCYFCGEMGELFFRVLPPLKVKGRDEPLAAVRFKLHCVRYRKGKRKATRGREELYIWCKVYGPAAAAIHKHKQEGDHIMVGGRICQRRFVTEHGPRWMLYLFVEHFQFLWPPPRTFVKGHVVVPQAEYQRLKMLSDDPYYVPPAVVDQLEGDLGYHEEPGESEV